MEQDLAWLAGIFEGEGTAGTYPSHDKRPGRINRRRLVVSIPQKERALLEEVKKVAGCGTIHPQPSWGGYQFVAASRAARNILTAIYPYVRSPRRKAQISAALGEDQRLRAEGRAAQLEHLRTVGRLRNPITGRFDAQIS